MKKLLIFLLISIPFISFGCKKTVTVSYSTPNITSPEYINSLLFVTKNIYQIATNQATAFFFTNTHIKLTSTGLIQRLTSTEVIPILIKWNLVKMESDKSFTFEGAVSREMFKYWRDLKVSQK